MNYKEKAVRLIIVISYLTGLSWQPVQSQTASSIMWEQDAYSVKAGAPPTAFFSKYCDLVAGNDIVGKAPGYTDVYACMKACAADKRCTHFLYSDLGSISPYYCWLKSKFGEVTAAAYDFKTADSTCGFMVDRVALLPAKNWYPVWQSNVIGTLFAKNCQFDGNNGVKLGDLQNVPSPDACIEQCMKNLQCSHFMWYHRDSTSPYICLLMKLYGQVFFSAMNNENNSTCGFMVDRIILSVKTPLFNWQIISTPELPSLGNQLPTTFMSKNCDFNALQKGQLKTDSYTSCSKECQKNPDCTHFTFTNKDSQCYIKTNNFGEILPNSIADSSCGFFIDRFKMLRNPRVVQTLPSVSVTNGYTWPDWNYVPTNICPRGTAALAFTLKMQPFANYKRHMMSDVPLMSNRAVVGLRLHCGDKNGQLTSTIESQMSITQGLGYAVWGEMSPLCNLLPSQDGKIYSKLTSFRIKVHHYPYSLYQNLYAEDFMIRKDKMGSDSIDVVGVTDVAFKCSVPGLTNVITPRIIKTKTRYLNLYNKTKLATDSWGDWSGTCPTGICGFKGRFDDFQYTNYAQCHTPGSGISCDSKDDAGLTNLEMICCPADW